MVGRRFIAIGLMSIFAILAVSTGFFNQFNENSSDIYRQQQTQKSDQQTLPQKNTITTEQLAVQNGKNGKSCWIAVNGTVYDVTDNPEWVDGEHVPSRGQASCGRDLSNVIGQSPHGTSVLGELTKVGELN